MRSIVWVMILIVPAALLLRVLLMAFTNQRNEGSVRSRERAEREDGRVQSAGEEKVQDSTRARF